MANYAFYGWERAAAPAVGARYEGVRTPRDLYDMLCGVWCAETCAPRLRAGWSPANPTLGQCSITAFLAQDIFGGEVYGILRPGGNYHCYNVVGGQAFDLTSEQFGAEKLCYEGNPVQSRELHFAKEEKRLRYELLRRRLREKTGQAAGRLRAFEAMLADLVRQAALEKEQMEKLKAAGREKSATYRQYFGNRMLYSQMLALYRKYGLIDE